MSSAENICLWEQTSNVAPVRSDALPENDVDVAIIGAGYFGLSTAEALAEAGQSVTVIEKGEVGQGASGRNGGQVQAGFGASLANLLKDAPPDQADETRSLASGCADRVFALVEKHKIDCDPVRAGLIRGIHHPRLVPGYERQADADEALEFWSADRAHAKLGAPVYHGAVFDRRAGRINPMAFVRGLAHAAQRAGARIVTSTPAVRMHRQGTGWQIETPRGVLRADRVVLATNTYTDEINPSVQRSLVAVNSFQIATEPFDGGPLDEGYVASDTRRLVFYYRRDESGRLIVGGRGNLHGEDDLRRYAFLRQWLVRAFPDLARLSISHFWAGRVGITTDHIPHLHSPESDLFIACGFNGKGVAMATALGERMARHLTGAPATILGLPIRPLSPIPLWRFRNLGVSAHVTTYRALDRLGM